MDIYKFLEDLEEVGPCVLDGQEVDPHLAAYFTGVGSRLPTTLDDLFTWWHRERADFCERSPSWSPTLSKRLDSHIARLIYSSFKEGDGRVSLEDEGMRGWGLMAGFYLYAVSEEMDLAIQVFFGPVQLSADRA